MSQSINIYVKSSHIGISYDESGKFKSPIVLTLTNKGKSYTRHISLKELAKFIAEGSS